MSFERIVTVLPAYDRRDPDPKKNRGICEVRIKFALKGPKGAVQFLVGTNWHLPATHERLQQEGYFDRRSRGTQPMGWEVRYHSPAPMYEGQTPITDDCRHLDGRPCYSDGSSLTADEWIPEFLAGGTDWLWPRLETYYAEVFEGAECATEARQ